MKCSSNFAKEDSEYGADPPPPTENQPSCLWSPSRIPQLDKIAIRAKPRPSRLHLNLEMQNPSPQQSLLASVNISGTPGQRGGAHEGW